MKKPAVKLLLCVFALLSAGIMSAQDNVAYQDDNVRFTVITDGVIRLEWQPEGKFTDERSFVASEREYPEVTYKIRNTKGKVRIETSKMILEYVKGPGKFTAQNLKISSTGPVSPAFTWHPGVDQKHNLKGTIRTLDWMEGDYMVKEMQPEVILGEKRPLEDGVLARDGWTLIDESSNLLFDDSEWGWVKERENKECQDWYFMAYGHDYKAALKDFTVFAGKMPLPPRFTFGYWWSRYWAYSDKELRNLVDKFEMYDIPLDVLVVDMDWHYTDEGRGGWTGWTWNKSLFPDHERFMKDMKDKGLKITLNLHPADGFQAYEESYNSLAAGMGMDPEQKKHIEWTNSDKNFMENMFRHVMHPMQEEGVDFWWLDWQQHLFDKAMPVLNNTWWINYCYFSDMERHGDKRPMLYHRWGGLGNHRYQVGFSGDATISWTSLDFQPYFTSTASNVLYGYWSHDIGGHMGKAIDPEMYIRWIQFGGFSPVMRTHSTKWGALNKEPWVFDMWHTEIIRETVRQRYDMVPYIYTMARKAYEEGLAICRPLYYDWPELQEAYDFRNEYMFGDDILIAPVTKPGVNGFTEVDVWLPEGNWYELHTGTMLRGGQTVKRHFSIKEYGIYIKEGAVLPFYGEDVDNLNGNDEDIYVTVFPGRESSFTMYEDAGNDKAYAEEYGLTEMTNSWNDVTQTITIAPRKGSYKDMSAERKFKVKVVSCHAPKSVTVNGVEASYDYQDKDFSFVIDIPETDCSKEKVVCITYSSSDPFITDGVIGKSRRVAATVETMKYCFGCDAIDPLAKLQTISEAVYYAPEKSEEMIDDFRKTYSELPEHIKNQWWLQEKDWEWFLTHCGWYLN